MWAVFFLLFTSLGFAETVEFSSDELAQDSVLPVFFNRSVTRSRKVTFTDRFEFGLGAGLLLAEPVATDSSLQAYVNYHWSESQGIHLIYAQHNSGLSSYASELQRSFDLNFSQVPRLENSIFAYYQHSAFYGKFSLTKQTVFNMSIYGLFGLGSTQYTDGSVPALSAGVGQKIYFSRNWSLRGDLTMYFYNGPNFAAGEIVGATERLPLSSFPTEFTIDSRLAVYLSYLF